MKKKKISMFLVLLLAFLIGSGTQVFADVYNGGKWSDPQNVRFMNNSTHYKTYVNTGALHYWNNYTNAITFVPTNDALISKKVLVYDVDYPSLTWDGQAVTTKSNGYFTKAEVKLNEPRIENSYVDRDKVIYRVVNHEFGHTIGLGDLYGSGDTDVLMYGYTRETPYYPTTTDLNRLDALY